MKSPLLTTQNLEIGYINGKPARVVISSALDLNLYPGEFVCLVGPNGAGKSTLLRTLTGLLPLLNGEVLVGGKKLKEFSRKELASAISVVLTTPIEVGAMTVNELVAMGRFPFTGLFDRMLENDWDVVKKSLEMVGLMGFEERMVHKLSDGERQKVMIARALAQEGQVILLDEPFTGVDVKTEDAIVELLRALRDEGKVMLVSTHNLGSVPEFCDRTVLVKGTVLASGPTEEIFTREWLEETFGGALRHFVLAGPDLHDDDDPRHISVLTDDERPLVMYGEKGKMTTKQSDPVDK